MNLQMFDEITCQKKSKTRERERETECDKFLDLSFKCINNLSLYYWVLSFRSLEMMRDIAIQKIWIIILDRN